MNREKSIKAIQLSPDKVSLYENKIIVPTVVDSLDDDAEEKLP